MGKSLLVKLKEKIFIKLFVKRGTLKTFEYLLKIYANEIIDKEEMGTEEHYNILIYNTLRYPPVQNHLLLMS